MQTVINIPKEDYNRIKATVNTSVSNYRIIKGISLSKVHGYLVDVEDICNNDYEKAFKQLAEKMGLYQQ